MSKITPERLVLNAVKKKQVQAAMDAFVNNVTGAGTARAKVTHGHYCDSPLLTMPEIEMLMKDNDLARKIVMQPVEDALRAGFDLCRKGSSPTEDHADMAAIKAEFHRLMRDRLSDSKLKRAATSARAFGGGGLILGAESKGGSGLASPLDDTQVTNLSYVIDFDRQDLTPASYYLDGTPETFNYTPFGSQTGAKVVHESRIAFFPGAYTTNRARWVNLHWDHSVLQAVYQVLLSFDQMFSSTDAMFNDASQAILKLSGLIQSLAEADGEGIQATQTRLQLLDMMRSASKAIFLEAGSEDGKDPEESYEVVERTTLGTLDGVMEQYYTRLAAAAGMPLTVLLGQAPSGMDATGESDMLLYFNRVDVYRKHLTPIIHRICTMIARSLGIALEEEAGEYAGDNDLEVVWPELQRQIPLDQATADNMRVTSLTQLIQSNVILPEEAALSLREVAPSLKVTIDTEAREKALEEGLSELENREITTPTPEEAPPTPGVTNTVKKTERKTPAKAANRQV